MSGLFLEQFTQPLKELCNIVFCAFHFNYKNIISQLRDQFNGLVKAIKIFIIFAVAIL